MDLADRMKQMKETLKISGNDAKNLFLKYIYGEV